MAETSVTVVGFAGGPEVTAGFVACALLVAGSVLDPSRVWVIPCARVLGEVGRLGGSSSVAAIGCGVLEVAVSSGVPCRGRGHVVALSGVWV